MHDHQRRAGRRGLATSAILIAGLVAGCSADHPATHSTSDPSAAVDPGSPTAQALHGPHPQAMLLSAYRSCDGLLAGLRAHTAKHVTGWGLPGSGVIYDAGGTIVPGMAIRKEAAAAAPSTTPAHSTTNNQEQGVDEPDTVQTDGRRVISISDGTLRIVDAASHAVTGTLDLSIYAGADNAQMLMTGDRVLVLLGDSSSYVYGVGPVPAIAFPGGYPGYNGRTTAILVDISHHPTVVSSFHAAGGFVAARMVNGTVRLVVRSTPLFRFPKQPDTTISGQKRATAYRKVVEQAPLSAWLPTYTVTSGGASQTHTASCGSVRHPADYTGTSLLSVYTIPMAGTLRGLDPLTVAADGTSAYATAHDLYVASSSGANSLLHRFDIRAPGEPTYLGSAKVPGVVQDSYSMSQYRDSLRVVTTVRPYGSDQASAVYVVDARTLRITGHVSGLGRGEQLHAVRFLGPLAYVVTFESVDPLYVLDLHDPAHPRKAGELKITGYSDYLHPTTDGRLLGVGEDVRTTDKGNQMVSGLQVSLFDVDNPTHPRRLDRVARTHTPSETPIDPHAFLYWPRTGTAVIPIDSWDESESGAALVLHVDRSRLRTVGTIRNPAGLSPADDGTSGIERTLVIGDSIWTMSSGGMAVSDLQTLHRQAWIAFS
jgi:hypothetical protein